MGDQEKAHSLRALGGTGSGMGTPLISKIREEYPHHTAEIFSASPVPTGGNALQVEEKGSLHIKPYTGNQEQGEGESYERRTPQVEEKGSLHIKPYTGNQEQGEGA